MSGDKTTDDKRPHDLRTKHCRICGEDIKEAARFCIHCKNWQGWRAELGISNTALSLVVAIIAVLTAAIPVIKDALTPQNSRFAFAVQRVTKDGFSALVSNQGIRPGTLLHEATILIKAKGSEQVGTYNAIPKSAIEEIVIEPGKSMHVDFQFNNPLYTENISSWLKAKDFFGPDDLESCRAYLSFINFDGKDDFPGRPFDCKKLPALGALKPSK
jgi:hypothetical protein